MFVIQCQFICALKDPSGLRQSGSFPFCTHRVGLGASIMLVYQGRTSWLFQYLFSIDTHSFSIYICQWPHIPFVDGLMGRKSSFPHALRSSCRLLSHNYTWFLGLQFNFARQWWHWLCRLQRKCSLSFFDSLDSSVQMIITGIVQRSPGCQPWSNTHREWARRGSEPSELPVYPASDWQVPCCCNNLPREDVKNPLMLRWENCMHGRFKPKLSNLRIYTKRTARTNKLLVFQFDINEHKCIPFVLCGMSGCCNLKHLFFLV